MRITVESNNLIKHFSKYENIKEGDDLILKVGLIFDGIEISVSKVTPTNLIRCQERLWYHEDDCNVVTDHYNKWLDRFKMVCRKENIKLTIEDSRFSPYWYK